MNQRIPALNSLRIFEAAARLGSFKKAAEELVVTPSAVSHQVSELESLLGVTLFKRVSQGIELTAAARACLPKLQEGLDCVRESICQLRQHAPVETIVVAASPTFAMRWLMPRLHRFVMAHPELDVQVSTKIGPHPGARGERSNAQGINACAEEADIALMYGRGQYAGLEVEKLLDLTVTPMCSPALLAASDLACGPQALARQVLIHDDRGLLYSNRSYWQIWLDEAHVTGVGADAGPHFTHASMALSAAIDGGGVVATTPILAADELASGRLVRPFEVEAPLESGYHMVSTEAAYRRPEVAVFRQWLRAEAAASQRAFAAKPVLMAA